MGAEPYEYEVPYEADIQSALDKLRRQVFESGEFNGAELGPSSPEEAMEMAEEEGTASILDISRITSRPDYCCAAPFTDEELEDYFGTTTPDRTAVEEGDEFWDDLERGQARYIILHENSVPKSIYFVGNSFD